MLPRVHLINGQPAVCIWWCAEWFYVAKYVFRQSDNHHHPDGHPCTRCAHVLTLVLIIHRRRSRRSTSDQWWSLCRPAAKATNVLYTRYLYLYPCTQYISNCSRDNPRVKATRVCFNTLYPMPTTIAATPAIIMDDATLMMMMASFDVGC